MRTFVSKTYSLTRGAAAVRGNLGFTLIEILVVVLVVSILMGVVVASFGGTDREQTFRGYAERLALRIEMARDRALQSNREWGLYLGDERVYFAEFDEINGDWVERADKPFRPDEFDSRVEFDVEVEEFDDLLNESSEQDDLPTIVLFSSGETTPFTITLEAKEWETWPWVLESDGFTRTSINRDERL